MTKGFRCDYCWKFVTDRDEWGIKFRIQQREPTGGLPRLFDKWETDSEICYDCNQKWREFMYTLRKTDGQGNVIG